MTVQKLYIGASRSIDIFSLDATLSESHQSELTVTDHPVEFGAAVSDHAVLQPVVVTVVGEVTDTPMSARANDNGEIVFAANDLFGSSTNESKTRAIVAYEAFEEMQRNRRLVSIQTGLRLYDNCLLLSFLSHQETSTGNAVGFVLRFKRIIIADTETISVQSTRFQELQLQSGATRAQGASTESSGRKEPMPPEDSRFQQGVSVLSDLLTGNPDKSRLKAALDALRN